MKRAGFLFSILICLLYACSPGSEELNSVIQLNEDWQIQSSGKITKGGEELTSSPAEEPGWFNAKVPSTVFGSLFDEGIYPDVFFGKNLEKVDRKQFQCSWWYRKVFALENSTASHFKLEFDGIIYRANIWLNGKQIASADTLEGPFRQFSIDVSSLIKKNAGNVLAVEVFPPKAGDFTVGFVDWNPEAPDRGMGIWREVRLRTSGDVSLKYPFVVARLDTASLKSAELIISCEVQNNTETPVEGDLTIRTEGIDLTQAVLLKPGETRLVKFSPEEFPSLKIRNPRIWWTHDLGTPERYDLKVEFVHDNRTSDALNTKFGIRDISSYTYQKYGRQHNGYKLNGKKILVKGGGWVDQLFLIPDSVKLERQIEYVKHMHFNTIRPEGFWGNNHDLYDICDREGVLIMTGWSCQWEWPVYCGKAENECDGVYGCVQTQEEIELVSRSWKDMVKWLRNHPSIFMWMTGSDMLPLPGLEQKYIDILEEDDPTRPMVTSAYMRESTISGWSGMKMEGPYEYVPPVYWYIDTLYGGAYGFNTETGPGAQVPPIESVRKMIPADSIWPVNDIWEFHCGRNEFQTLSRYNRAMNERFGEPASLEEYCMKAQLLNYESIRPMFEAFQANRYEATGIIQWMLNSSWPKLIWQLYGFDLLPNGALYGTRKALEPLQAIYDYAKNEVVVSNSSTSGFGDLTVRIKILNLDMQELISRDVSLNMKPDQKKTVFRIPGNIEGLDSTYFLDLRIFDRKRMMRAVNQYVLTKTVHEFDWKSTYFAHTPTKKHQNLQQINDLPKTTLASHADFSADEEKTYVKVEIANDSPHLALSLEIMILNDASGDAVAPVYLDDNYFSLLPGERRVVEGHFYTADLKGQKPVVTIKGLNLTTN